MADDVHLALRSRATALGGGFLSDPLRMVIGGGSAGAGCATRRLGVDQHIGWKEPRRACALSRRRLSGAVAMTMTLVVSDLEASLDALEDAVGRFQSAELDQLSPKEELELVGRLEILRRRLDAGTDRAAGHLDRSRSASMATSRRKAP